MMPNVAGEASTRKQIFVYSLLLAPVGVLPWALASPADSMAWSRPRSAQVSSGTPGKCSSAAGEDRKPAKLLFAYSIAYLFAIFAVLLADTIATRALAPALG